MHDAVDGWSDEWGPTFSPHAHLEALLQTAILALVPVVIIYDAFDQKLRVQQERQRFKLEESSPF